METINDKTLNLEFWTFNPVLIKDRQTPKKLETKDVMALRYAAEELLTSRYLVYEDKKLTREEIMDHSAIRDNELELADFEGYKLSETETIRSLFLNEKDRVIAEVWDDEDNYSHYLVY